jgi:hypothetical protein
MNATLNEFISSVKDKGMANANRYFVAITGAERKIGLFCDNAQLPGTQILSTPARTFGEIREVPYELSYDPITLTFYIDNEWQVKRFFDVWRESVFDPVTRVAGYYNDFVRDVTIYCYNKEDKKVYTIKLLDAYPKTIGSVQLDYGIKDVPKLSVTLQYQKWEQLSDDEQSIYKAQVDPALGGGLAGGFGGQIDFANILGGYFKSDVGAPSQYLSSFGGFQNTFNSFNSNPAGTRGQLGGFRV